MPTKSKKCFQLKTLTYTIQLAQNNVANAQQAAEGAQRELAEKTALVDAARGRVESLKKEIDLAKQDLTAIRQAAQRVRVSYTQKCPVNL